jgi:hypothetical protein
MKTEEVPPSQEKTLGVLALAVELVVALMHPYHVRGYQGPRDFPSEQKNKSVSHCARVLGVKQTGKRILIPIGIMQTTRTLIRWQNSPKEIIDRPNKTSKAE